MFKIRQSESGHAMFMVVMATMTAFLLGTAMLSVAGNSKKDSIYFKEQLQAYYIAEAGVEKALARAVSDWEWLEGTPYPCLRDIPLAGGRVVYSNIGKQEISGGYLLTIESKGQFGSSNRTIVVTAQIVERQNGNGSGNDRTINIMSWKEKYGVF